MRHTAWLLVSTDFTSDNFRTWSGLQHGFKMWETQEIGAYVSRGEDKVEACCGHHGNKQVARKRAATSSEAGQIGRSATLPRAALQRQGAGQRMLALLPGPALLAVTPATVTLAVTCGENGEMREEQKSQTKRKMCTRRQAEQRVTAARNIFLWYIFCLVKCYQVWSCLVFFFNQN